MIKAILTDLDGVLRYWDNRVLSDLEEANGMEKGILFSYAFNDQFVSPALVGKVTHEEWIENVANALEKVIPLELVKRFILQWQVSPFEINWQVMNAYQAVFPSLPIVLVTNATTRLSHDLKDTGLPESLEYIINSSDIGFAKPDPAFFETALRSINCSPDEVLFIDDQYENVIAATKVGLNSFHFQESIESLNVFLGRFS